MPNPGTKHVTDIAARRRNVGRLYLQGKTQREIGNVLEVSQPTISRDLTWLRAKWLESALIDVNEAKTRELAKIDALELTYYEAWERSCEDAETLKQKGQPGSEPGKVQTESLERTVKGQAGDPRFLQGVQWCIERRCKILGIDAPGRTEISGRDGGPITIINKSNVNPDTDV